MMRVTFMDGKVLAIDPATVEEILPFRSYFTSSSLKPPIQGLFCFEGRILPVVGAPLAKGTSTENVWLMREKHQIRLIRGLPVFAEETNLAVVPEPEKSSEEEDLDYIEELIKSA